jgi:hypothetical protein
MTHHDMWLHPSGESRPWRDPEGPGSLRTCLERLPLPLALVALSLAGCGGEPPPEDALPDPAEARSEEVAAATPADLFHGHLAELCGRAFAGGLTLEPPGDDMLTGTEELIVHFRTCGADTLRIPFHIEIEETGAWDRSRTWMIMRSGAGALELRHDHREPDGTPSATTMYGGVSDPPGTANRQEFPAVERTGESGVPRGWRIEIVPGERYTYGTTRRGEWSWRVDFDLTREVPPPPAPWGHGEAGPDAPGTPGTPGGGG